MGEGGGKLDLAALQNTYQLVAQNVKMARSNNEQTEASVPLVFKPGDLVTVRDHMAKAFEPKYKGEYQIIEMLGTTWALLRGPKGMRGNITLLI